MELRHLRTSCICLTRNRGCLYLRGYPNPNKYSVTVSDIHQSEISDGYFRRVHDKMYNSTMYNSKTYRLHQKGAKVTKTIMVKIHITKIMAYYRADSCATSPSALLLSSAHTPSKPHLYDQNIEHSKDCKTVFSIKPKNVN